MSDADRIESFIARHHVREFRLHHQPWHRLRWCLTWRQDVNESEGPPRLVEAATIADLMDAAEEMESHG